VHAARGVFHHARHEFHGIAQAVAVRIRDIVDLCPGQMLLVGCLGDVHGRGLLVNVHRLEDFANGVNGQGYFSRGIHM